MSKPKHMTAAFRGASGFSGAGGRSGMARSSDLQNFYTLFTNRREIVL